MGLCINSALIDKLSIGTSRSRGLEVSFKNVNPKELPINNCCSYARLQCYPENLRIIS